MRNSKFFWFSTSMLQYLDEGGQTEDYLPGKAHFKKASEKLDFLMRSKNFSAKKYYEDQPPLLCRANT